MDDVPEAPRYRMADMLGRLLRDVTLRESFPNLSKLAAIALVLPVSSVECERAFSFMNRSVSGCYLRSLRPHRIKTIPRNRMKNDLLNWPMILAIHVPDRKKFNYNAAVDYWAARWNHRVKVLTS